jgi:hypothetical protein
LESTRTLRIFFLLKYPKFCLLILNNSWPCTDDSLLHLAHESWRMNSLKNFYICLFQWCNNVVSEQSLKDENPVFALICNTQFKYACTWPTFTCLISVQLNQQIQNHHFHFVCTYWHAIFIHIL